MNEHSLNPYHMLKFMSRYFNLCSGICNTMYLLSNFELFKRLIVMPQPTLVWDKEILKFRIVGISEEIFKPKLCSSYRSKTQKTATKSTVGAIL